VWQVPFAVLKKGAHLLSRASPPSYLALDHIRLMHELAESLVEVLVDPVRPTRLFLPVGIGALDRKIDPAVIFNLENLHVDLLSFSQIRVNILDEVSMNFGYMYQPRDIGRNLDECTEILKPDNLALHDGSWLD
jgi:hypothetical protein